MMGSGSPFLHHSIVPWFVQSSAKTSGFQDSLSLVTSAATKKMHYSVVCSIPQEFLERLARLAFPRPFFRRRHKLAPDPLEIFAIIGQMFFRHRIGAAVPALLRHARIVADAVQ